MDTHELTELRQEYTYAGLSAADLAADPIDQFRTWFGAWHEVAVGDPNAMVVATATPDGRPSVRTVLLRAVDGDAFVFFTNYDSRKGRELADNPRAALLFPWHPLGPPGHRRGTGRAGRRRRRPTSTGRPGPGAARSPRWRRPRATAVPDRASLERRWDELEAAHRPRRAAAGGLGRLPGDAERVEFWQGRDRRLHDRLVYERDPSVDAGWRIERLAP